MTSVYRGGEPEVSQAPAWEESFYQAYARTLTTPGLPEGALGFPRAWILGERDNYTISELCSHYVLQEPGHASELLPEKQEDRCAREWLVGRVNGQKIAEERTASEVDSLQLNFWENRLRLSLTTNSWVIVAAAYPEEKWDGDVEETLQGFLGDPYPFPWGTLITPAQYEWVGRVVVAVVPRVWADVFTDMSTNHRIVKLPRMTHGELAALAKRTVSDVELFLSLPEKSSAPAIGNFARIPQPPLAETLSAFVSLLPLPEEVPASLKGPQRVFRARVEAEKGEGIRLWGGRLAIAVTPTQQGRLGELLGTASEREKDQDPVVRLLGLLQAFRVDPDEGLTHAGEPVVYQGFWPYFFSGYWRGVDKGLALLSDVGAEFVGVFASDNSEDIITVFSESGEIVRKVGARGVEHNALAHYLEEQRSWAEAYDLGPRAPDTAGIPDIV